MEQPFREHSLVQAMSSLNVLLSCVQLIWEYTADILLWLEGREVQRPLVSNTFQPYLVRTL